MVILSSKTWKCCQIGLLLSYFFLLNPKPRPPKTFKALSPLKATTKIDRKSNNASATPT